MKRIETFSDNRESGSQRKVSVVLPARDLPDLTFMAPTCVYRDSSFILHGKVGLILLAVAACTVLKGLTTRDFIVSRFIGQIKTSGLAITWLCRKLSSIYYSLTDGCPGSRFRFKLLNRSLTLSTLS